MATNQEDLDQTAKLLDRAKTEGITDASGNILKSSTISTDTLSGNNTNLNLPTKEDNTSAWTSAMNAGNASVGATKTGNDGTTDLFTQYLEKASDLNANKSSSTDLYSKASEMAGYTPELQTKSIADKSKLDALMAQLTGLTNAGTAENLKLEGEASGKNITTSFLSRQQQEVTRQTAIKALPLQAAIQAQQAIVTNNTNLLTNAKENLNTYYSLLSKDADNEYTYKTNLLKSVYDFASEQEKAKLDKKAKEEERLYNDKQANLKNAQSVANSILQSQPDLASKISQIDWNSPTAQKEYANLISQVKETPEMILDRKIKQAQLYKLQKETQLLGEPTEKDKKTEADKLKTEQGLIDTAKDKITLVDSLVGDTASYKIKLGKELRVGPNALSRKSVSKEWYSALPIAIKNTLTGGLADLGGAGQAFSGGVHRLASQEFINNLIDAKSKGATFGALTDREGDALRAAATQINDWEIKDNKGQGTGVWDVSQSDFDKELNRIKTLAQKAISKAGGTLLDAEEDDSLNSIFNQPTSASNYYSE